MWAYRKLTQGIVHWLIKKQSREGIYLCDFEALRHEVRLGDVLLIEGTSRVSKVIRHLTLSPWSHAALYIGRIYDIESPEIRQIIKNHLDISDTTQLIVEGMLGKGIIVSKLSDYAKEHIRICRPKGISHHDAQAVVNHAVNALGKKYDVRHIFDLARWLFPWSLFPRRWGSSLFKSTKETKKEICSSLIAEAFEKVNFPVLPMISPVDKNNKNKEGEKNNQITFSHRNPKLYVPSDFDYSPYFEIIKYPMINIAHAPLYRTLPWEVEAQDQEGREGDGNGNSNNESK